MILVIALGWVCFFVPFRVGSGGDAVWERKAEAIDSLTTQHVLGLKQGIVW